MATSPSNTSNTIRLDIWMLYASEGMTYQQIADHLNIQEKYVKKIILNIIETENSMVKKTDSELSLMEKALCINRKITPPFVLYTNNVELKDLARKLKLI